MRIRLFGGLAVTLPGGEPVRFATRKSALIVAALALSGPRGIRRELLAETFWPSRSAEQARNSLRQALVDVRRSRAEGEGGAIPVTADLDIVALDFGRLGVDVIDFENKVAAGEGTGLLEAALLYRGDLLSGHTLPEDLDTWFRPHRIRFQRKALQLAEDLSRQPVPIGSETEKACVALAERLLGSDAAAESAHRALIRIYRRRGQENLARRQFDLCRGSTRELLGEEPEAQTRAALDEALDMDGASDASPAPHEVARSMEQPEADVPSLAVLPFQSLGAAGDDDYFADGIIEDITTALSRFSSLVVVAPGPAFAFDARRFDAGHVGGTLGARYLVKGSVRRSGDRLRITVQLVLASTGATLWSDRFDGTLADVLDLQERVALDIVGAIAPKLETAEIERARRKPTSSLDAYDLYLRGIALFDRPAVTRESIDGALDLFKRAIGRDGEFAAAYARAARCFATYKSNRWFTDAEAQAAEGVQLAVQAIRYGRNDAVALSYGGFVLGYVGGDLDECASCVDQALALNPNLTTALGYAGWVNACLGEPARALESTSRAMRLSPMDTRLFAWQFCAALASLCAGDYGAAVDWSRKAVRLRANYVSAMRVGAASHALAGEMREAQAMVRRLLELDPTLTLAKLDQVLPPLRRPADRGRIVEGLRKAGLD